MRNTGSSGLRGRPLTGTGWYVLSLLVLFAPLIQGGTPRLPTLVVELSILLLVVWWGIEWGWKTPRQELRLTLLDGLLGLFLFWGLFSFLFAPYYHSAEKALLLLVSYAALYWFLTFHPSLSGLEAALFSVRLQGVFQASLVWYQWGWGAGSRPIGTFYNPNFLAGFLAAAALLAIGKVVFPSKPERRARRFSQAFNLAAAGSMIGALMLSGSRGGVLALVIGILVLLSAKSRRLALVGAGAGTAGLFLFPNPWIERIRELSQIDVYAYTRLSIWKSALEMVRDHPWFGIGLGQFEYFSPRYAFPVGAHWAKYSRVAENAHSEYLQVGAEMGILGLALWLAALAAVALWSWRWMRGHTRIERGEVVPLLAALGALLLHAAVDFNLHTPPAALLLVLLVSGVRMRGVTGDSWVVEFRYHKVYGVVALIVATVLMGLAARPVAGFWYYLRGTARPQNLFREKWALEEARRELPPLPEALTYLRRAVKVDFPCAPYHSNLGGAYFQTYFQGEGGEQTLEEALYHAHLAAQLNPNNYRYPVDLAQAMTSLYRLLQPERSFLREAVKHYRRAMVLSPKNYAIYEELGLLYDELEEYTAAEETLREAVRLEPNYLRGWYNLGIYYARRGLKEKARRAYLRGMASARQGWGASVTNAYEQALVDFDPELFEDSLMQLEMVGPVSKGL